MSQYLSTSGYFQLAVGFLSNYEAPDVTEITLDGKSTSLWGISPPSRKSLIKSLENNKTDVMMEFHITFTRFVVAYFFLSEKKLYFSNLSSYYHGGKMMAVYRGSYMSGHFI